MRAQHAFYNCSSLSSVTIPASVTSIGDVRMAAGAMPPHSHARTARALHAHDVWMRSLPCVGCCACPGGVPILLEPQLGDHPLVGDKHRRGAHGRWRDAASLARAAPLAPCMHATRRCALCRASAAVRAQGAFSGCSSLSSVTIPSSVTSIAEVRMAAGAMPPHSHVQHRSRPACTRRVDALSAVRRLLCVRSMRSTAARASAR